MYLSRIYKAEDDDCPILTHPGWLLDREVKYRKIKVRSMAKQIGIPYSDLREILDCKKHLTQKNARIIAKYLGVGAALLIRLQKTYDTRLAKRINAEKLNAELQLRLNADRQTSDRLLNVNVATPPQARV
jgi:plasmid maintenance system antidote protein VapI